MKAILRLFCHLVFWPTYWLALACGFVFAIWLLYIFFGDGSHTFGENSELISGIFLFSLPVGVVSFAFSKIAAEFLNSQYLKNGVESKGAVLAVALMHEDSNNIPKGNRDKMSLIDKIKHGNVAVEAESLAKYHHQCQNFYTVLSVYLTDFSNRPMNTPRYGKAQQAAQMINDGQIKNYADLGVLALTVDAAPMNDDFHKIKFNMYAEMAELLRRQGVQEEFISGDAM